MTTSISNSQLALLSTLAYLDPPPQYRDRAVSVGDIARYYLENPSAIRNNCAGMDSSEWEHALGLMVRDTQLSSLNLAGYRDENTTNGLFAYHFTAPGGGGDVVAFRGSEGDKTDWGDNFFIAWSGADGTTQQQAALGYINSLGVDLLHRQRDRLPVHGLTFSRDSSGVTILFAYHKFRSSSTHRYTLAC